MDYFVGLLWRMRTLQRSTLWRSIQPRGKVTLLHGDAPWNKDKPRLLPHLFKGRLEEVNVTAESDQQSALAGLVWVEVWLGVGFVAQIPPLPRLICSVEYLYCRPYGE